MAADTNHWNSIVGEFLERGLADQVFRPSPTLDMFWRNREKKTGRLIDWRFTDTRDQHGQTYKAYGTFLAQPLDFVKRASLDWKPYVFTLVLSDLEIAQANTSEDKYDLVKEKIKHAESSMRYQLSKDLYGDGTPYNHPVFRGKVIDPMDGLELIVKADRTYAGHNSTNNELLNGFVNDISGVDATFDNLSTITHAKCLAHALEYVITTIGVGGDRCDWISMTKILKSALTTLAMESFLRDTRISTKAEFGYADVAFMGIPVIDDDECGDGRAYCLNGNHINFAVLKSHDMKFIEFREVVGSDNLLAEFKITMNIMSKTPSRHGVVITGCTSR